MRTGAVVRRRQLGRALRELREAAGFSLEVAAPRLDWSSSKLSRIENGQQAVDVHGVRSMLDLYDGAQRWEELVELTRQTRQKGWWRAYGLDDRGYVPLEAAACLVRDVTLGVVPGLLQTPDYARALFESSATPRSAEYIDNAVEVRMVRQRRLKSEDDPLTLVAIIDESVVLRPVGGAAAMRRQLDHLVEAMALPAVTLQVLPLGLGGRPAMSAVFTLLSFGDTGIPDMVYADHPMGAIHLDKESDVARAILVFDRLQSLALCHDDSLELIKRAAVQL